MYARRIRDSQKHVETAGKQDTLRKIVKRERSVEFVANQITTSGNARSGAVFIARDEDMNSLIALNIKRTFLGLTMITITMGLGPLVGG